MDTKTMDNEPIRVLIVDDEVAYAALLAKRMRLRGMVTRPVNGGQDALKALRGGEFDVALLDLKMENMDGIETLKVFRVIDPEMKVIILTGHGGEAEAKQCITLGAFDYLLKPCELETIVGQVQRAAAARRAERTDQAGS
ncbi:MAG: response regulator [Desulfovibrionaceae bacterium]